MMQQKYEKLMRRCINLAKKSKGRVSPNPLVGCVIVDDNLNVISEGRHEYYGGNHAERNAILKYNGDLKGKSLIVNLEPCVHYGKTPPCADLIIEKGIKRVIIGIKDPNPIVCSKGIEKLKNAGIEVVEGVLESECRELNKFFIKNQIEKKPYIMIKTALTFDGKIAGKEGIPELITDEISRKEVHRLRNEYDAVLTSSRTVINDNPKLTCRIKGGRNPIRVILDTHLKTPINSSVYNDDGIKVYVITSDKSSKKDIKKYPDYIDVIKCPEKNGRMDIVKAINILYNKGISSIMVESGGELNKSVIEAQLADELIQFLAPKILGDDMGISFVHGFNRKYMSKCNNLKAVSTKLLKNDIMINSRFLY